MKLKLIHNLYSQGKLVVRNGMIMIKSPGRHFGDMVISVPPSMYPGLANALHMRFDHPSKNQLANLLARYFYTPGWRAIIDELSEACHQCRALRKLPKVLIEDTHSTPDLIAAKFSADVIERESQKILVVREHVSQFTIMFFKNWCTGLSRSAAHFSFFLSNSTPLLSLNALWIDFKYLKFFF